MKEKEEKCERNNMLKSFLDMGEFSLGNLVS